MRLTRYVVMTEYKGEPWFGELDVDAFPTLAAARKRLALDQSRIRNSDYACRIYAITPVEEPKP